MPPLPRLRIPALDDLARQIRFEPAKAARRQLELAEALAGEIDPNRTYPEEWVVFRLTGYRPDAASQPVARGRSKPAAPGADKRRPQGTRESAPTLLVGAAVLADLPAFVERLSVAAKLTAKDLGAAADLRTRRGRAEGAAGWLDAPALCKRWKISRKTLDRLRRGGDAVSGPPGGLLARRVIGSDARHRLYFRLAAIEAFESRHADRLRSAAGFTRIDAGVEARMLRRAARYRRMLGCSLNQAAARLAARFGRSHEGVRQLLQRHDRESRRPLFGERPPIRDRQRRLIARASARGIEAAPIAAHLGIDAGAVYRSLTQAHAAWMRTLDLSGPVAEGFDDPGATAEYLSARSVRSGLGRAAPETLAELLALAEELPAGDPKTESAVAAAYCYLRFLAARGVAALPKHGATAAAVDEIETRLRWAARLKAELVRAQVGLVLKSIQARLGRPVTHLPNAAAARLVTVALDATIEALDRYDPFKGGRAAAPVGIAINRAVAQWMKAPGDTGGARWISDGAAEGRGVAAPRADAATVVLDDWSRRVCPWQQPGRTGGGWGVGVEPDRRVRVVVMSLPESERGVLVARMGWMGEPPVTLAALAAARTVTPAQIVRLERRAIRTALGRARAHA